MVDAASGLLGVNVAVLLLTLYVADTSVPPAFANVKVEELTVVALRTLLNVAVTVVPKVTPVAPLTGVVEFTLNGVGPVAVVNDQV